MVDRRLSEEVLKAISPLGVKASLKAMDDLTAGEVAQRATLPANLNSWSTKPNEPSNNTTS